MKDTITDTLKDARNLIWHQRDSGKLVIEALDQIIEHRRLELAAIRVTLAEAVHALNTCREQCGCAAPVVVTEAITRIMELQKVYEP